jgi:repressor LexA
MLPEIKPRDLVLVRRQADVDSGQIAVVVINDEEATLKKIKSLVAWWCCYALV